MSDKKIAFWFIALLSVLVLVPFLGETIFYSKGEPREAIVAYTMLESGNWILPMNYGVEIAAFPLLDNSCYIVNFRRSIGVFGTYAVGACFSCHAIGILQLRCQTEKCEDGIPDFYFTSIFF